MDDFFYHHETKIARIGDLAPAFRSVTTQGAIYFPADYFGKWVILFGYSPDFAPEDISKIKMSTAVQNDFKALNCEFVGVSVDGLCSQEATLRSVKERVGINVMYDIELKFPLVEDISLEVAKRYRMIPPDENHLKAIRAVFVIDPQCTIRSITYYSLFLGLNFDELKRVIVALQTADDFCNETPDGKYGIDCKHVENQIFGMRSSEWFLCTRELSEEKVLNLN